MPALLRGASYTKEKLRKRIKELGALTEKELAALGEKAKNSTVQAQERIDEEIKRRYFVR